MQTLQFSMTAQEPLQYTPKVLYYHPLSFVFYYFSSFSIENLMPLAFKVLTSKARTQTFEKGSANCQVLYTGGANLKKIPLEPRHEKTCFSHRRTTKAQISLRIRTV